MAQDQIIEIWVDGKRVAAEALNHTVEEVERALDKAAPRLQRVATNAFKAWMRRLERKHGRRWSSGTSNTKVGRAMGTLQRRSGRGLKSIKDSMRFGSGKGINNVMAQISPAKMTIHETGGVIRPRRAKFLAIPLPDALNKRGIPLKSGPRAWKDTQIIAAKKSGPWVSGATYFIVQPKKGMLGGQTGENLWLYALVRSVTIRPRLGMKTDFDRDVMPELTEKFGEALTKALTEGGK